MNDDNTTQRAYSTFLIEAANQAQSFPPVLRRQNPKNALHFRGFWLLALTKKPTLA